MLNKNDLIIVDHIFILIYKFQISNICIWSYKIIFSRLILLSDKPIIYVQS